MLIGKVLLVLQQAQLGVDGAAPRHNARDAVGCEGDVAQQDTCVDRPIVDTLWGLCVEGVVGGEGGEGRREEVSRGIVSMCV